MCGCHILNITNGDALIVHTDEAKYLLSLHVNTSHGMFVNAKYWYLCLKQEDQLIEWMNKGQAMELRINVIQYKRFVLRHWSPLLWEKLDPFT